MAAQNGTLGYIIVDGDEGRQIRGAALVVDFRGIPVEFRYTDPIRPTRLERILYGRALDVYLREELVLQSLLSAVEVRPPFWACNSQELLGPLKTTGKVKPVFLAPSSRPPLEAVGSVELANEPGVLFLQADAMSAPLRAAFPQDVRPDEIQQTVTLLVEAAKMMELLEPFSRIQKALQSLASEE